MADAQRARSKFNSPGRNRIGAQSSEEGEAHEKVAAEYTARKRKSDLFAVFQEFLTSLVQHGENEGVDKEVTAKLSESKNRAANSASLLNSKTVCSNAIKYRGDTNYDYNIS